MDALKRVYEARICRNIDGARTFYSSSRLCACDSNLAAISWFFARPYEQVASALDIPSQAWLLNEAGQCLCAQGRFTDAMLPLRAAFSIYELNKVQQNLVVAA